MHVHAYDILQTFHLLSNMLIGGIYSKFKTSQLYYSAFGSLLCPWIYIICVIFDKLSVPSISFKKSLDISSYLTIVDVPWTKEIKMMLRLFLVISM